ncbi:MAG: hypothetical protein XD93_0893 [candidate division WS6 bacterium 34_10]|uniref:Uncharacterized protein n=1 Tax=candidate division WS6 bacterium 34_10 TaxID=1641389 RepID=A0A117LZP9_9BACT|nr:MAG: hypothetical protein XD93_0893 [candidate division WS6 bacterium 34_10]
MKTENIEKKDLIFFMIGYIVIGIVFLIVVVLIIYSIIHLVDSYQVALEECTNKGYDISYCKSLLN